MKQLMAYSVMFKRKRTKFKPEGWEPGLYIGKSETDEKFVIFDMDGKKVTKLYDWYGRPHDGCITIRGR